MVTVQQAHTNERLSVSMPRQAPPRNFTDLEMQTLRVVADTLIPAANGNPSGSGLAKFEGLVTRAAAILDKHFATLTAILGELSAIPSEQMWDRLRELEAQDNETFYLLSTLLAGAYLYSDEMKAELQYPAPHRNPPGLFDAADELSTGILDPVIERGPIFVRVD